RGVAERRTLDAAGLRNGDARWLDERREALATAWSAPATLALESTSTEVAGPLAAFERILGQGRKGLAIQRFKGLGEMNPDQLWKTTLDPAVRTLLRVSVDDIADAEE